MNQQDNFQEKTEQPTPKRLADARRKGNVARSRELSATAVMLGGSVLLLLAAEPFGRSLTAIMTDSLSLASADLGDPDSLVTQFGDLGRRALYAGLPLLAVVSAAALLSSVALGGWSFSPSALAFKAERISILKGLKRVFGVRGLVELLKALAKFAVIAAIAIAWLRLIGPRLIGLSFEHPAQALVHSGLLCLQSLIVVSLGLILITAVDAPFQLWQHRRNLKMTRQEVRDEQKETDGKPEVKQRIRLLQQQRANQRMMDEVPQATVVITNPTHYAVAVRYDQARDPAPVVVAKGRDRVAARIREIADDSGVALFSAPPLARVLFRSTKLGQQIPYELYTAVAQVLAYVLRVRDAARPWLIDRPELDIDEAALAGFNGSAER